MKVRLPENISEITLEQFQKFDKLLEREGLDEHEFNKRKLVIFAGLKYHDLDNVSHVDFKDLLDIIDKGLSVDVPFKNTFILDGVEYGFIPNLEKMSTSAYVDLRTYDGDVDSLHKTMAILFRPVRYSDAFGNYKIESYKGTEGHSEAMKRMPFNVVNGALVFFLNLSRELQISTQRYIHQEVQKAVELQSSSTSGDGTQRSMN